MSGETVVLDEVAEDNSERVKTESVKSYQGEFKPSEIEVVNREKAKSVRTNIKRSIKH